MRTRWRSELAKRSRSPGRTFAIGTTRYVEAMTLDALAHRGAARQSTRGDTTDERIAALRIRIARSFEAESIDDPDRG